MENFTSHKQEQDLNTLTLWQNRLAQNQRAWAKELEKMEQRERVYRGDKTLSQRVTGDHKRRAAHVRNMTAELIEAQVDAAIPQPKVMPRRKEDQRKARLIEDMLRDELNRLPFASINDMMERTVPIQGGGLFLVEWDSRQSTHFTAGELTLSPLHPSQFIPQEGVFTSVEDMDYFILKLPQTRESLEQRYAISLEGEEDTEKNAAPELLTQYVAYYRNARGGVGKYSWVGSTPLEHLEDYQRRQKEEDTLPSSVPDYTPDLYPVILQRNVTLFGQLLGDSDVDKIADQQNTCNRIETKIIEKLVKSGSYLVLPEEASIRADAEELKVIRPGSPADAQMIGVKDLEGNISQDMAYLAQVYEEARQVIGVTDSFLGRRDTTATSGRAKEFSAAQAAGRLESKRVMKNAAYAKLFEAMFKFRLAYGDEPRTVTSRDLEGTILYDTFDPLDFLEQDSTGTWYWNDQFLFSCDTTAPLAGNREAMWQETRQNLESGAFGDPTSLDTLLLFWSKMEMLHYPGAGETKQYLEQLAQKQQNPTPLPALSQGGGSGSEQGAGGNAVDPMIR